MTTEQDAVLPPSIEELLSFVSKTVCDHFAKTGKGLAGTALAYALGKNFPHLTWAAIGMRKMGDLVHLAEARGMVIRRRDVTHLELTPGQLEKLVTQPRVADAAKTSKLFVKPDLWRAMVLPIPKTRAFFNRTSGDLKVINDSDTDTLKGIGSDSDYAIVEALPSDTQTAWLRDFLRARGALHDDSPEALRALARGGLSSLGPNVAKDWQYARSLRAKEYIAQWAARSGIPDDTVFLAPNAADKRERLPHTAFVQSAPPAKAAQFEEKLRQAIIASIGDMTFEELRLLALPLRCIIKHFEPR